VQTGPIFTFVPLKPKGERINPVAGFKRVFNKKMLFEAFKSLLKLGILGTISVLFFRALWPQMHIAMNADTGGVQSWFGANAVALLFRLGLALLLIGLLDLAYTRFKFGRDMMMSRREMKEEVKRREGDPLIRAKLRELQRENLKQAASVKRVPEADVLITNPDHLAIALRYERGSMAAPIMLAKGADSWAAEMRATARRHGIPIYQRKPLARLLFRSGQLGQSIPADSYLDVARIYAELDAKQRGLAEYEVRG
jgi:flagellar biosynthetic protein FlhB